MSHHVADWNDGPTLEAPRPEPTDRPHPPLAPIMLFVIAWLGGSWLVVGAWLAPILPGGWLAILLGLLAIPLPLWRLALGFRGAAYPSAATRLLILRPFWYALLGLPLLASSTLIGALIGLPFGVAGPGGRWALGLGAAILGGAALAGYVGSRRLVVRPLEARLPRLAPELDGLRVVQISDLHVGPHTPKAFLRRVAQEVMAQAPDLIAITGDQVDDFARDTEIFNQAFADLQAPLGTFVVAGNHDVYAGWQAVHRGLEKAGFQVLVNDAVAVERQGARLWVAGTGDPAARGWPGGPVHPAAPDLQRTLAPVPPGEAVLALAHNPALWPALAKAGVDLTLSGHTHYGQLAVPKWRWSLASPFLDLAMGGHRRGRSLLYINPGTNYWGIPMRLGTPPEVTVITLRSAETAELQSA